MRIIVLSLFLASCAGSPLAMKLKSKDELSQYSTEQLCRSYGKMRNNTIKEILKERNAFDYYEWLAIEGRKIYVGQSETAMFCSIGDPSQKLYSHKNVTNYGNGNRIQYVNRACRTCKPMYIYIKNGKVTAWQN